MIVANQLSKSYGSIKALNSVSLEIGAGEIVGLLGPNGAGKTTLFKIICGLLTADSGNYEVESRKRKAIGAIIEKPGLYEYISARDNLKVLSRIQGAPRDQDTIDRLLKTVGLPLERLDVVKNYSLGMKQRLGLATALINDPDCLILDEPFLGLDPLAVESLSELIKYLAREKQLAVLVSSHLLGELNRTCDKLLVIQSGRIINAGNPKAILEQTTKKFMICGRHLSRSKLLQKHLSSDEAECVSIALQGFSPADLIKSVVESGVEVDYFGPQLNLNELYKGS
jgi:ABC-type multidrug transport system ATPase subunit